MYRTVVLTAGSRPVQAIVALERVTAPLCALALILHPTPLTWPALLLGLLPSAGRWITAGRPWRRSPFDVPLALFVGGAILGLLVTLDPSSAAIRLTGLASAVILFAWAREHAETPRAQATGAGAALVLVLVGAALMIHVAAPFLRLDRVPPFAVLAAVLEPFGLYRVLVADDDVLQRFRLYASGVGAIAAVGLAMTAGLALGLAGQAGGMPLRQRLRELLHAPAGAVPLVLLGGLAVFFAALLVAADNRGSMIAAALTLGTLVVWWRPKLLLLAVLLVFGTVDLIAIGLVQRGLNLRTVVERLEFWRNGLLLAAETLMTGVGLGVDSVQATYHAAFQPTFPPFAHTHSIYVQALLEQGIVGFVGLAALVVVLLRLGALPRSLADAHARAAGFAAAGGALALLTAGLTEIVALTTVGGALLFGLLGLLAAVSAPTPRNAYRGPMVGIPGGRGILIIALAVLGALFLTGLARPLVALPFVNLGTTALYRATLHDDLDRTSRAWALSWAVPALQTAVTIDPDGIASRRNLGLALAAGGDRAGARRLADEARARIDPTNRDALFGIGRVYMAADAWEPAIDAWAEAGAGARLLRLGRQLAEGDSWRTGVRALVAAAKVGAPGRSAPDAITRAALAHGRSTEQAIEELTPLVDAGGSVEYYARLQIAHVYRQAGHLDRAEMALARARGVGHDEQYELEQALILAERGMLAPAEERLRWILDHPIEPPQAIPDGDDPRYWLALVQARQGKHAEAVRTARAGLAALPDEQASLRVPYALLLGESLLALGQPAEAEASFRSGQRIAPTDPRLADGIARARAARR